MIEESKKIEFWNYLTAEKNQPRPKGITSQRLAVVKPLIIESDLWFDVIERYNADRLSAREFYQTADAASNDSRASFWESVRGIISLQGEINRKNSAKLDRNSRARTNVGKRKRIFAKNARKRI